MEWSDHLYDMAPELNRLERQASYDEIHVSTRGDQTRVSLVYEHDVNEGDSDGN